MANNEINITATIVTVLAVTAKLSSTTAGVMPGVASFTSQEINDDSTQAQRDNLQRIIPIKSGQTTSHESFDDGATELGRGSTFFVLDDNNLFSNTNRFTDEDGLQVYGADYVIDHLTGLGWKRTVQASNNFETQLSVADALTFATFSDWRVSNAKELVCIASFELDEQWDYSPFDITVATNNALWTSTTRSVSSSARGIYFRVDLPNMAVNINKTTAQGALVCRNHY